MKRMLADVCPELINEWSQRNLPLTPDSVTHGSNKIVWWNGKCGHECCVDSFPRGKALMTTVRMTFCSSPTKLTICRERYSAIIHRRSFSSRSLIESTGLPEPRRREFSSLVATLLPRKTRGNLLQTKKLFQLAIAICGLNFFKKFSKSYFKNDLSQWVQVRGLFPSNRKRPFHEL